MFNIIVLKKGCAKLAESEYRTFQKGDTIFGDNSDPEEIQRWVIEDEEEARKELEKRRCSYNGGYVWDIEEYALEYCECDESGEFIQGSDYELAKEE
ncbi:MAG: hypothetical protein HFG89_00665 [Dorea sp.]|nr:hypothetical protein [Dorea sp.]